MIKQFTPYERIEPPCYVANMPADIYHAHDSISNSGLKLVSRSPAHFKYQPIREPGRNMVLGSALHMACLEPDLYDYVHTNETDRRTKKYKEFAYIYGGDKVLTLEESMKIEGIQKSLHSNKTAMHYLSMPGNNELSGFVADPESGVICRHRFDRLTDCGTGIDLKTTIDARQDAFSRAILNYGYHQQAAFYSDQYEWITGDKLQDFIFIAIESSAPYAVKVYHLDEVSLEIGRADYRKALNTYAQCKINDAWPAYESNEVEEISVPQWALNKYDYELVESMTFTTEEV